MVFKRSLFQASRSGEEKAGIEIEIPVGRNAEKEH